MKRMLGFFVVLVFLFQVAYAADEFKPYLHNPTLPKSPEVKLYGQYNTNLYAGAATYSYPISVPKGVNGLSPMLTLSYNSQSAKGIPSILGSGWSLTKDMIYLDINHTVTDTSDDMYKMVMDGNTYELSYVDGEYKTKVDYYFRIQNISNYWIVTKQDGTQYRFGYGSDSRLDSNTGQSYTVLWVLDTITDTFGNEIYFYHDKDPRENDVGSLYLSRIEYNTDRLNKVYFTYENSTRSDLRSGYMNGNFLQEAHRLTDIQSFVNDDLFSRVHIDFTNLTNSMTTISNLTYYGSDNSTSLYSISLDYYLPTNNYTNSTTWKMPVYFGTTDTGIRFVDYNNDGYPDIVRNTTGGTADTWLNAKNGTWINDSTRNIPVTIVDTSGKDLGVRFADINKDGFEDIIKSYPSAQIIYLNNGSAWNSVSLSLPEYFTHTDGSSLGNEIVDVNGDGYPDLVKGYQFQPYKVYLNTHNNSWVQNTSWVFPSTITNSTGQDAGTRFADLNGDGLIDILESRNYTDDPDGFLHAFINNGTGWNVNATWKPPVAFVNKSGDAGVRIIDVNGDGLSDLSQYFKSGTSLTVKNTWLNTGSGWKLDNSWETPEAYVKTGQNVGLRLADVNADGFVDIVYSISPTNYTWIRNDTRAYLLKSITNEFGGTTIINYMYSSAFDNTENNISQIGFSMPVVERIVRNNSLTGDFSIVAPINYSYAKGKYSYRNNEFRGFGVSTEFLPSGIMNHTWYQDDARKGKENVTSILESNGTLLSKSETGWNYSIQNGIYNLSVQYKSDYLYDGLDEPIVKNISYYYNKFGNYEYIVDHGDINVEGDELYYNYTYGYNLNDWIINKVSRETVYDEDYIKIHETKSFYDDRGLGGVGENGKLTKKETWNSKGNNTVQYISYDSYGNAILAVDSLGRVTKSQYDPTHRFVIRTINPLGFVSEFEYNETSGTLLSEKRNNLKVQHVYDQFGRSIIDIQPVDSVQIPTTKTMYDFDGVAPESITVQSKLTTNKSSEVQYFYDGFGNTVQIRSDVGNGSQIVKNIFYDDSLRASSEQNPYYESYSSELLNASSVANITQYQYDASGRVVSVTNVDGTQKSVVFAQYNISDYDELGNYHTYTLDSRGRIIKVYELVTEPVLNVSEEYITNYNYDENNNLILITDNLGNSFEFVYNSLGQKVQMIDPDMGTWTYEYDTQGNLIKQTDSRNESILLYYDELNRITSKNSTDVNISWTYDTEYLGSLSSLTRNADVTYTNTYDEYGRLLSLDKDLRTVSTQTRFLYDSQGHVISQPEKDLDYIYNIQGQVENIPRYLSNIKYNSFGALTQKEYANGLVTIFDHDLENNRIKSISTSSIQNLMYTYDSIGNILSINDTVLGLEHELLYDDLYRMISATIGNDSWSYAYDSLGKIQKVITNNESYKYQYNGLAHAPSSIFIGERGVDIYKSSELSSESRARVFEFMLVNDDNAVELSGVNISVLFGNNDSFIANNFAFNDSVLFLVENNYTYGGDYSVNITANSSNMADSQSLDIKFGARAYSLSQLFVNGSDYVFEFEGGNDINETILDASWNCTLVNASLEMNLSPNSVFYDYMFVNYTQPGQQTFSCTILSDDGNETVSKVVAVTGVTIDEFDTLSQNVSERVVSFEVENKFTPAQTNISFSIEGVESSRLATIDTNEKVLVFAQMNYSTDGLQAMDVHASAHGRVDNYTDVVLLRGISLDNYARTQVSAISQVYVFDVVNKWLSGMVTWNLSDPDLSDSVSLDNNESVMVFIESNYTQGVKLPVIEVKRATYIDSVRERFDSRPLELATQQILAETSNGAVAEYNVTNNLESMQYFDWTLDNEIDNITSTSLLNVSDSLLLFIQTNYSNVGVYGQVLTINSTSLNDTRHSAVVIS